MKLSASAIRQAREDVYRPAEEVMEEGPFIIMFQDTKQLALRST